MVCLVLFYGVRWRTSEDIQIIHGLDIPLLQHIKELEEHLCRGLCIIYSPVVMGIDNLKFLTHSVQSKFAKLRQKYVAERHSVQNRIVEPQSQFLRILLYKSRVKWRIVCYHYVITAELHKSRYYDIIHRCILYHVIVYGGELFYLVWDRNAWIDKLWERVNNLAVLHLDSTYLYDLIVFLWKSCRLYIKYYIFWIKTLISGILDQIFEIVYKISLDTVYYLEIFSESLCMIGYRESLNHAVICDGYGRMSPVAGTLDYRLYVYDTVHLTHLGVHMEFDPLLRICIHTRHTEILYMLHSEHSADHDLLGIWIKLCESFHPIELAFLDLISVYFHILRTTEHLKTYGVCKICDITRQDNLSISELSFLCAHDLAVYNHFSDTIIYAGYLKQLSFYISSYEHIRIVRISFSPAKCLLAGWFLPIIPTGCRCRLCICFLLFCSLFSVLADRQLFLTHSLSVYYDVTVIPEVAQNCVYLLLFNKRTCTAKLLLVRLTELKCDIDTHIESVLEHLFNILLYLICVYTGYLTILYRYGYYIFITVPFTHGSGYQSITHIAEWFYIV